MTTYQPEDEGVEATELLVRERFEATVGSLSIDSAAFVGTGVIAGWRMARRRRLQQVGAGVAAVAVITVGGVVALQQGMFDSHAGPAATLEEMVPSTPRGLAAAVIADLPPGAQVTKMGGIASPRGAKIVEADLRLSVAGRQVAINTMAVSPELPSGPIACKTERQFASCLQLTLPNGDRVLTGTQRSRVWYLLVTRADSLIGIQEQVLGGSVPTDPPISVAALQRIGEDTLVGLRTSASMERAGAKLSPFGISGVLAGGAGGSSSSSSSTPHRIKIKPSKVSPPPSAH